MQNSVTATINKILNICGRISKI